MARKFNSQPKKAHVNTMAVSGMTRVAALRLLDIHPVEVPVEKEEVGEGVPAVVGLVEAEAEGEAEKQLILRGLFLEQTVLANRRRSPNMKSNVTA